MKVADILRHKGSTVQVVHSWTPVPEAVARMAGPPLIGALVVSDDGRGHVDGLITERDLIRGLRTAGPEVCQKQVSDFMSHRVPLCTPDDSLTHVMQVMTNSRYRHVPIVTDGVLCGLVSIGDVVRHRLDEMQLEAAVLRDMTRANR